MRVISSADELAVGLRPDLSMNRSIDCATSGMSRSHSPSKVGGIASYSARLILTIPVTWLIAPS